MKIGIVHFSLILLAEKNSLSSSNDGLGDIYVILLAELIEGVQRLIFILHYLYNQICFYWIKNKLKINVFI